MNNPLTKVTLAMPPEAAEKLSRLLADVQEGKPEAIAFMARLKAEGFDVAAIRLVGQPVDDTPAPTYTLVDIQARAIALGHNVREDARAGCYDVYDNPTGFYKQGETAHAFCVGLREVSELLDTLPHLKD